ncbi:stimulated by retinoic acid gene 8 protein-like isoform X1 [Anguilla rostrata]|uniref:stimulated by retinoic acid gene 8 protein-like isoform X1 n=1 Tax=Anguilla rostrata TaxID=7938 RepID=UPI0030CDDF71
MASRRNGSAGRKKEIAEHQKERRRALQARHRATLAGLFDNLRKVVCPLEKTPAKWKILHHAKDFFQEQEAYLEKLLSLKETFLLDADGPYSLQEVRDEYRRQHCQRSASRDRSACPVWKPGQGCPGPRAAGGSGSSSEADPAEDLGLSQSTPTSQPDILEFEGYLLFYRRTLERLLGGGVLLPDQTGLPVVSEAISALWQSLPLERRASYQDRSQEQSSFPWGGPSEEPPLPDTPGCSSQNSQGASGSSGSTFEEDLLQDAYDVVQKDLSSGDSPELDLQKQKELYDHIISFVKRHMAEEFTQVRTRKVRFPLAFFQMHPG